MYKIIRIHTYIETMHNYSLHFWHYDTVNATQFYIDFKAQVRYRLN